MTHNDSYFSPGQRCEAKPLLLRQAFFTLRLVGVDWQINQINLMTNGMNEQHENTHNITTLTTPYRYPMDYDSLSISYSRWVGCGGPDTSKQAETYALYEMHREHLRPEWPHIRQRCWQWHCSWLSAVHFLRLHWVIVNRLLQLRHLPWIVRQDGHGLATGALSMFRLSPRGLKPSIYVRIFIQAPRWPQFVTRIRIARLQR